MYAWEKILLGDGKKMANLILFNCARLEILGFNHLALVEHTLQYNI